jgi:MFS family permease
VVALLGVGYCTLFAFYGGYGLLVQSKVAEIEPANKALALAVVAGISALCITVANPLGGLLSDRTRSRLGSRVPWMAGGAMAGMASALLLAPSSSIPIVAGTTCLAFATTNVYHGALAAIVPDRIPRSQRGRASAAIGLATVLGWVLGTQVVARMGEVPALVLLGLGPVLATVLFSLFLGGSPEPRAARYRSPRRLSDLFEAFGDRDFALVFTGRALLTLSYYLILVYLLYILQDYVDRPQGTSGVEAVAMVVTISGGCALFATLLGGFLADRTHRYRLLALVGGGVGAVALLIPLLSNSWSTFAIFAAVQGVAIGVYYAADTALATLVLPSSGSAGRDLGILNIAASAPPVVAPLVAALIVSVAGYGSLFAVASVGALIGATAILGVRRVR